MNDDLSSVIDQTDAEGALRFATEEVRALVPLIVFPALARDPSIELPPSLARVLSEFLTEIGVDASTSAADAARAFEAHYEMHPISPELRTAVEQHLREAMSAGADLSFEARNLIGGASATLAPQPAPEGSVKSGPFARFILAKR